MVCMGSTDRTNLPSETRAARRRARVVDPLSPAQRRTNMQRVRTRNTKPELLLRRALHAVGLRFRLNKPGLPCRPDLVLPRWKVVMFVHGCFWHGHKCSRGVQPRTNVAFWDAKIAGNQQRDVAQVAALHALGWRVGIVWECALVGRYRLDVAHMVDDFELWLRSDGPIIEITESGNPDKAQQVDKT